MTAGTMFRDVAALEVRPFKMVRVNAARVEGSRP